jgi:hypothetical protein
MPFSINQRLAPLLGLIPVALSEAFQPFVQGFASAFPANPPSASTRTGTSSPGPSSDSPPRYIPGDLYSNRGLAQPLMTSAMIMTESGEVVSPGPHSHPSSKPSAARSRRQQDAKKKKTSGGKEGKMDQAQKDAKRRVRIVDADIKREKRKIRREKNFDETRAEVNRLVPDDEVRQELPREQR